MVYVQVRAWHDRLQNTVRVKVSYDEQECVMICAKRIGFYSDTCNDKKKLSHSI